MQILRIVIVERNRERMPWTCCQPVLPTNGTFADFMDSGFKPTETNSIVLVVSTLNALIRDQVTKLRQCGLKACILKVK